jgi:MOSC domain-containing protein YiiM
MKTMSQSGNTIGHAQVDAVMIAEQVGTALSRRLDKVRVEMDGFAGDRHAGPTRPAGSRDKHVPRGTPVRNDRQVSVVSLEEMSLIAAAMEVARVDPAWLGANLAVSSYPELSHLPPGTELIFEDGAQLVVEDQNRPCTSPGELIQAAYPDQPGLATAFPKVAYEWRGLLASVVHGGEISVGDRVEIRIPAQK